EDGSGQGSMSHGRSQGSSGRWRSRSGRGMRCNSRTIATFSLSGSRARCACSSAFARYNLLMSSGVGRLRSVMASIVRSSGGLAQTVQKGDLATMMREVLHQVVEHPGAGDLFAVDRARLFEAVVFPTPEDAMG